VEPPTRNDSNWHGVELRHLIALRAVAAERSFSAAARSLGYTQSAVSGQVLALERLIGARLFVRVRGTRPLELTDEGKVLLVHATAILERLQVAQLDVGAAHAQQAQRLRVGSFWGVAGAFMPAICRRLGESAFDQLELREEGGVDAILDGIERRKLDLAFTSLPPRDGPFQWLPVCHDPYMVVMKRGERVGAGPWLTLDELAGLPLLTLGGCRAQDALELVLQARGRPLDIRARFDTVAAVLAFVAEGFGIGLLPSLAVELPPSLAAVPLDPRVPPRMIGIVWHRERTLDGLAQQFVEAAVEVAGALERGQSGLQAAS
jgi:DNA-binding transcriptional LysR family regulator